LKLSQAALLSALTGFVALSYEILWVRTYSFAALGEAHCFGELLGSYLFGLAIGAYLTKRWCAQGDLGARGQAVSAVGLFVGIANVAGYLIVPAAAFLIRYVPHDEFTPEYGFARWTVGLYAVAAAFLGTTLPLIAHAAVPPDERAGVGVARLYVANIIGSTVGSLLTGFWLMDVLPLRRIAQILCVIGAIVCLAVVISRKAGAGSGRRRAAIGLLLLAFVLVSPPLNDMLYGQLWERLKYKEKFTTEQRFERIIETKSGVICVDASGGVYGGGAYDGMLRIDPDTDMNGILRAYALAVLHPVPKRVLMIGLGSGAWTQVVANHPAVEHVTVVEINPGYIELMRHYPVVASVVTNPKVELVVDDGRRWLNRHAAKFDFIFQNTTHHWRSHCTNLVSMEYMQLIAEHLLPGGVSFSNTTESASVTRTVCGVFPYTRHYRQFVAGSMSPLTFDPVHARDVLLRWRIDGAIMFEPRKPFIEERISDILGAGRWEEREAMLDRCRGQGAEIITDDNMASEFRR
jgi:spermidine synthase